MRTPPRATAVVTRRSRNKPKAKAVKAPAARIRPATGFRCISCRCSPRSCCFRQPRYGSSCICAGAKTPNSTKGCGAAGEDFECYRPACSRKTGRDAAYRCRGTAVAVDAADLMPRNRFLIRHVSVRLAPSCALRFPNRAKKSRSPLLSAEDGIFYIIYRSGRDISAGCTSYFR